MNESKPSAASDAPSGTTSLPRDSESKVREPPLSAATANVPPQHRQLHAGEILRRTDKFVDADCSSWTAVNEQHFGNAVPEPNAENHFVRYCRPIRPDAQNWYVDLREGRGDDEHGTGSTTEPFATYEGAKRRIEEAAKAKSRAPHGMLWDVRGTPLFAWDMVELKGPENSRAKHAAGITTDKVPTAVEESSLAAKNDRLRAEADELLAVVEDQYKRVQRIHELVYRSTRTTSELDG